MTVYKYKAMNDRGERIEGQYEADSKEGVIQMISSNNYYPLLIEEAKGSFFSNKMSLRKVKTKDIAIFCRQLYTMLDAGSSINNSLHVLSTQVTKKKLKEALEKVEEEVRKGSTISDAMKLREDVFPELLISMVATGELSGNLDTIMLRMANHYEKETKINNKVKSAMIYPAVLSIVAIGVVIFMITFILPMFMELFNGSGVELPLSTRILLGISSGIKNHGFIILGVIIIFIMLIRYYFKSDSGQVFSSKLKLSLPVIKKLNEKIIVSRFTRTLSTVLASGMTLVTGLEIVKSIIGNKVVEVELNNIKEKVIKGEGLSEPVKECGAFPMMLSSMIKIGEESGSLDEILNKTADFYDEELETQINSAVSLIEPMMIVIMGIIVAFMIISIIKPMFQLYNILE